jgi:pantoate--beta-alanine ligase
VQVVESIAEMHRLRNRLEAPVSMMATLGGMHAGHQALLARAREEGASLVASLFLNPTQFGDPSDLERYPQDVDSDLDLFERMGVDVVFRPSVEEMYRPGHSVVVDPGAIGSVLEGAQRPGHFVGVATVVAKILCAVRPDVAVWGAKDAQQNVVIRRLTRDLCMEVRHVIVPTVRADDGLALSSRNTRLSDDERRAAAILFRALSEGLHLWEAGERDAHAIRERVRAEIEQESRVLLDYVSVAAPETLTELESVASGSLLALAARVGPVRLIDNVVLE